MRFPRSLFAKTAIFFIALGVLPMAAVGVFAYWKSRNVLTVNAVEYFVARVARDTADRLDTELRHMSQETTYLATNTEFCRLVAKFFDDANGSEYNFKVADQIQLILNERALTLGSVDMFAVLDGQGRIMITSAVARPARTGRFSGGSGDTFERLFSGEDKNPLANLAPDEKSWWNGAKEGAPFFIDFHVEGLVQRAYGYPLYDDKDEGAVATTRLKNPEAFSFGFARGIPVYDDVDGRGHPNGPYQATLVAYYNWSMVQDLLDQVDQEFATKHPLYRSGYTFMFRSDCDTIIGHKDKRNLLTSLTGDHKLEVLHRAMLDAGTKDGICDYVYKAPKISGFSPVPTSGWRLGFGINESDIFAEVDDLRNWMLVGALLITGTIMIAIALAARRLTEPIKHLIEQTEEIARGNLDARVAITTNDEIAVLGDSFNKMAEDLKASNKRLIQAEKTAAWREMARQVAHEIKNPLTPIKLSAQLIERAWSDRHEDFPAILRESVATICSQTESLRKIASDFSNYAAFTPGDRKPVSMRKIIEECVKLYSNRAASGIAVSADVLFDDSVEVRVDADEMKRVFLNLFNNAFEAMPDGGALTVSAIALDNEKLGRVVDVRVKDDGRGIPEDVQRRLFEPYFTTRSSGTGLGLAIAKRTIESYGGTIGIQSQEGVGTTVAMLVPIYDRAAAAAAENTADAAQRDGVDSPPKSPSSS